MGISRRNVVKTLGAGVLLPDVLAGARNGWAQAGQEVSLKKALALVIGLDAVDPAKYGGWNGRLQGCVRDAKDYQQLITSTFQATPKLSWSIVKLHTGEARISRVAEAILWAADALRAGDLFIVTYAGHGAQLPDHSADEPDRKDETWCLFDGQMRDDELYRFWKCFQKDVRIVVVSDSCHSGTIARMRNRAANVSDELNDAGSTLFQRTKEIVGDESFKSVTEAITSRSNAVLARSADELGTKAGADAAKTELALFREMPEAYLDVAYQANRAYYDSVEAMLPSNKRAMRNEVQASVLTLGAAQDHQLAMEISGRGLFTSTFARHFSAANSYQDLRNRIASQMPENQQPSFDPFGTPNEAFLDSQRPFSV